MTPVCSVFSQHLRLFLRGEFARAVKKRAAERYAKGFTCWGGGSLERLTQAFGKQIEQTIRDPLDSAKEAAPRLLVVLAAALGRRSRRAVAGARAHLQPSPSGSTNPHLNPVKLVCVARPVGGVADNVA